MTVLFLNTGACHRAQWSLLFPAYKAGRERRGVALPSQRRLAPPPFPRAVHELPGVLQRRHTGTEHEVGTLCYGSCRVQALLRSRL